MPDKPLPKTIRMSSLLHVAAHIKPETPSSNPLEATTEPVCFAARQGCPPIVHSRRWVTHIPKHIGNRVPETIFSRYLYLLSIVVKGLVPISFGIADYPKDRLPPSDGRPRFAGSPRRRCSTSSLSSYLRNSGVAMRPTGPLAGRM